MKKSIIIVLALFAMINLVKGQGITQRFEVANWPDGLTVEDQVREELAKHLGPGWFDAGKAEGLNVIQSDKFNEFIYLKLTDILLGSMFFFEGTYYKDGQIYASVYIKVDMRTNQAEIFLAIRPKKS